MAHHTVASIPVIANALPATILLPYYRCCILGGAPPGASAEATAFLTAFFFAIFF